MSDEAEPCWLCGRPMGQAIEWHHPIPKARKGRVKVPVHPICHRTVHANFTNSELGRMGNDVAAVRLHAAVARFLDWVKNKDPDFYAPTR